MQVHLGSSAFLVACNREGAFPVEGYTMAECAYYLEQLYGSVRQASEHFGKSRKFISAHARKFQAQDEASWCHATGEPRRSNKVTRLFRWRKMS